MFVERSGCADKPERRGGDAAGCAAEVQPHAVRGARAPRARARVRPAKHAGGVWRAFVTNAMPYVCLRAWLAAGFKREQFLLVPSARLRSIRAPALVSKIAQFTGLHYNEAVLLDKREELGAHCEAPETQNREASRRRRRIEVV